MPINRQRGIPTYAIFGASALFVFLVLAAQYETWKIPLAIVHLRAPPTKTMTPKSFKMKGLSTVPIFVPETRYPCLSVRQRNAGKYMEINEL